LKIGALVRVTVRRVWVSLASSYAWREVFAGVFAHLRGDRRPRVAVVT
jgi:hypothetical protein